MKKTEIYSFHQWEFKAGSEQEWLSASVPGCVHRDLHQNGRIQDPFYGTNERDLQWIDKQEWEYRTRFSLEEEWLKHSRTELVFEGLDTYADVYFNGTHVLSADNMFREWRVDVKNRLKPGMNEIAVRFRSVVEEDLPKLRRLGYALPATNDQSELGGLGEERISVFARKAPYHYGWDWGPRFLTCGIWREARLEGHSGLQIRDVYIKQHAVSSKEALLAAEVEIESDAPWSGRMRVTAGEQAWDQEIVLREGRQTVSLGLTLKEPKLWWCSGLGDPYLYTFETSFISGERTEISQQTRTGLRDIRLIREQDEKGTSFYFSLNGVPVFAKGANHIPNDSFIGGMEEERYRHEIATAAASGMNMLRVWGGGIYEEELFYRLCDEKGLLVWQDFMFACSMYPGDASFIANVREEAAYNVTRLRNHPCIALWCGNNEMDSAWAHYGEDMGWGWKKEYDQAQREQIWTDYREIFDRVLPEVVSLYHPGADYWPSSPLRALTGDENQHAVGVEPEGDVHYWRVWHGGEPFEQYNVMVGRFMSEYGFQSFPELKTVLSYAEESDLELESEVMTAHQKNGSGNRIIKEYMDNYLPEPKDFPSFLYMSQILQAEAIRIAIEAHRRNKPYCMGTLYWQLNDCWPVASWAGMDYYGRWKALQYTVRRSFKEVILSFIEDGDGGALLYAVSDRREPVQAVLRLSWFDAEGKLFEERTLGAELEADSSLLLCSLSGAEADADGRAVILEAVLESAGEELDRKEHFLQSSRKLRPKRPDITVTKTETGYRLGSDCPARGVYLTAEEEGIFSDNFFDLIPGRPKTVEFLTRPVGDTVFVPKVPQGLQVRTMADFI